MSRIQKFAVALVVGAALQGCSKHDSAPPPAPPAATSASGLPDVGKTDAVTVKAEGIGPTPGQATSEALKSAVLQVNGATIDTSSLRANYGLDIAEGKDAISLRASQFAEAIAQQSGGAVTNFKILSMTEPTQNGEPYKVTIEANIAHFVPPTDSKKVKVVIGPIKFDSSSVVIGSDSYPAEKVAEDIRQKVSIGLQQSGRFSVLDREMSSEIQNELNMLTSGEAPRSEVGKLGQSLTADLVWAGHVDNLAYLRHARKLVTSDRELVSYSGGWSVSQKLVNVATRQIFASDALNGNAPEVAPTTTRASPLKARFF